MHRVVQDEIENVLANSEVVGRFTNARAQALLHLEDCALCRAELSLMQQHTIALRQLRVPEELEPRPGFYARVLERIEAEGPASIWNLFMESTFGRRIAVASLALAVLLGVYLISSERTADDPMIAGAVQATEQAEGAAENSPAHMAVGRDLSGEGFVQVSPSEFGQFPGGQFGNGSPINQISMEQSSDDAVLSNLMTYREQ